jgi:hypothetical protein
VAAGNLDLALEQGATYRRLLLWRHPSADGTTPGPTYDLTDCTAHMQIRPRVGDPTVLVDLTDEDGINLGGTAGTIEIVISAAQTMAIAVLKAVYDLYVHFPNGDVVKVLDGKVAITPTVTSPVFP